MQFPPWSRTVRFRLTLTYSGLVFGIAAVVLFGTYLAVAAGVERLIDLARASYS